MEINTKEISEKMYAVYSEKGIENFCEIVNRFLRKIYDGQTYPENLKGFVNVSYKGQKEIDTNYVYTVHFSEKKLENEKKAKRFIRSCLKFHIKNRNSLNEAKEKAKRKKVR